MKPQTPRPYKPAHRPGQRHNMADGTTYLVMSSGSWVRLAGPKGPSPEGCHVLEFLNAKSAK